MQFEDFDKKVKEAADHHHPTYDEQAWTRMEKLLNKHLPQKEDDRRRFLFFFLLFLGLGGAGILIAKPWKKSRSVIATEQTSTQQSTTPGSTPVTNNNAQPGDKTPTVSGQTNDDKITVITLDQKNNPVPGNTTQPVINPAENRKTFDLTRQKNTSDKKILAALTGKTKKDRTAADPNTNGSDSWLQNDTEKDLKKEVGEKIVTTATVQPVTQSTEITKTDGKKQDEPVATKPIAENTIKPGNETVVNTDAKKDEQPLAKQDPEKKSKAKSKKQNSFFFTLSAGPDISFVNNNKLGEAKLLAGAGLGYTFNDRFTIRTGFYSGRKVYTAAPDAYHAPPSFNALYPYLQKVDANCKVYEIPVSLSYNFGKKSSRNWFASAGLSTFLMKEETYDYFYKYTPTGNTYSNKWTIRNENQHFFSVATISGGYKKNIGKRVTLTAEPYIKLPLSGVGYGKVKLNSGGVLFTVGIKLF